MDLENLLKAIDSFQSNCIPVLTTQNSLEYDRLQCDCESLINATEVINSEIAIPRYDEIVHILDQMLQLIIYASEKLNKKIGVGRPKIKLPKDVLENLLWKKFSVPKIANIFQVSISTIRNNMTQHKLSVDQTYTEITDGDLFLSVAEILNRQPNTGCKIMKGMLWSTYNIRVPENRLREAMRTVDPWGVQQRYLRNRAIVRRTYFVKYSHSLWHMDTNMKLIRYKIIIKGCIDGKSRFCIYLDVANNNRATGTLASFIAGVREIGCLPSRTRSDKGGENILVAELMMEARGTNRGSHLTGRSVHNQRIEKYWGDVYRASGFYYNTFFGLEENGILDIDDPLHLLVLHHVYIPRIQKSMNCFRNGWNVHPVSTEGNFTPEQLLVTYMAPSEKELVLTDTEIADLYLQCNSRADVLLNLDEENPIRNPISEYPHISAAQRHALQAIDVLRDSNVNGIDIFVECLNAVQI